MIPDSRSLSPNPFFYRNGHAKYQPIDIICILCFEYIGVHIFLCKGAQFYVQNTRVTSDQYVDNRQRQLEW